MTMTRKLPLFLAAALVAACGQEKDPRLLRLDVAPEATTVFEELTAPLTATAVYDDGTQRDVTAEASWITQDAAVARWEAGGVLGVAAGSTTLEASWGGLAGSATVDVTPSVLAELMVFVEQPTLAAGLFTRVRADGRYTNGHLHDVTEQVQWEVGGAPVELHHDPADPSVHVLDFAPGTAEVTVALGAVESPPEEVVVTDAVPVAMEITGLDASVPLGRSAHYHVVVTMSYGDPVDVTARATPAFGTAGIAEVVTTADGTALKGVGQGSTTVTITWPGLEPAVRTFAVTPHVAESLAVEMVDDRWDHDGVIDEVREGVWETIQVGVFVVYSDGARSIDLWADPNLVITSSDTSVASIVRGVIDGIMVQIAREGTTTLSATIGDLRGSMLLEVDD